MIKNIIFDLGNVIINYNQNKIINNFTQKEKEIKYIYDEIFHAPEWTLMDLGDITNDEAIEIINKRNQFKYETLTQDFLHEWYKKQPINRDIVEIAKILKNNGYDLFVLSNMANQTYEYFKNDEFFGLCTGIVISAQEHIKKPDEKVYRLLLDRYNLNAEECLFIDDDDSGKNYETANRIGIKGRRIIPNKAEDVKKLLIENGRPEIQIIAKIENSEGVENMDDILKVADGIMVARGDLGVEIPAEDVPLIQKELINKCRAAGKIVITATQMLDSMQENPRPTRAEVSDVANAIYDGTDAIMLSGESAQGKYPVEAVETMTKIALKTEGTLDYASLQRKAIRTAPLDQSEAICMSVAEIASKFNVAAIIAFTDSGFTARKMSRYRTKSMIIAATPNEQTTRALAINWGVKSVLCKQMDTRAAMIEYAQVIAKENLVEPGEQIIVTAGTPGVAGTTSYLELITVK